MFSGVRVPEARRSHDANFTKVSRGLHRAVTSECEYPFAMKENIVIPIKIERAKLWIIWTLEVTTWLIGLGLLAASAGVAVLAMGIWLLSGSEAMLTLGLGGGLLLGLAGVWQLLRKLEHAGRKLRHNNAPPV